MGLPPEVSLIFSKFRTGLIPVVIFFMDQTALKIGADFTFSNNDGDFLGFFMASSLSLNYNFQAASKKGVLDSCSGLKIVY